MNRVYNGLSKKYAGKFYMNLEDPNRIHYILDGDFYNNGTVSGEIGGKVGLINWLHFKLKYLEQLTIMLVLDKKGM